MRVTRGLLRNNYYREHLHVYDLSFAVTACAAVACQEIKNKQFVLR